MAVSALTSSLSAVAAEGVTPHAGLHRRSNCGASYCSDRNHLHMDMGGDDDPDDGTTPIIYSSINKSETELTDDIYTDSVDEGYTLKKGSYYLSSDLTLDKPLIIGSGINLCLDGHTLKFNIAEDKYAVKSEYTLNICDCAGGGKFILSGKGFYFLNLSSGLNIFGGEFSAKNETINVYNTGVDIYGGTVSGSIIFAGNALMYGGTVNESRAAENVDINKQFSCEGDAKVTG